MVDHAALAALHERCADAAESVATRLSQLACDAWRGGAGEAYRRRLLEVRARLLELAQLHRAEAAAQRARALERT